MEIFKMLLLWSACSVARSAQPLEFDAEAARLLRRVRLPPERLAAVPTLVRHLQRTMNANWPGTKVTPFGAIIAGLGIVGSDIDCFAKLPVRFHNRTVFEIKNILDQYPNLFHRPVAVPTGKMPHVRFVHVPTGYQCDVSFRHQAGVRNTALFKYLMSLDRRALDLTTIVKLWAKLHNPRGKRRIMSNYAMVSLAVFYLQQVNVLPSIAALQENADKVIIEQWNTGFDEITYRSNNNDTLYELLGGFFKYYNKFDFRHLIVSIFAGSPIKRSVFDKIVTVPDIFALYKRNVGGNSFEPLNTETAICVQDVFLHHLNIASDCSPEVLIKFKSDLRFAVEAFYTRDDFLEVILGDRNENIYKVLDEQARVNYLPNSTSPNSRDSCNVFQTLEEKRVNYLSNGSISSS